jgi:maltose-binding protein MalE
LFNKSEYKTPLYAKFAEAAAVGRQMPATPYYMNLADSVAAAVQELVSSNGNAREILNRHQTEFNNRYGGKK